MKNIFPFTDVNEKPQPTESSLDQRPRATAIERLIAYIAHIFVCVGRCVPIYAAAKLSLKWKNANKRSFLFILYQEAHRWIQTLL